MKWKFEKFNGDGAIYAFCPNCNYHYAAGGPNPPTQEPRVDKQFPFCPGCGEFLWCEDDEIEVVKGVRHIKEIFNEKLNTDIIKQAIANHIPSNRCKQRFTRECAICGDTCPTEDISNVDGEDRCYRCIEGYEPVCPQGYLDCVYDPGYIHYNYPEWYKKLYGDLKPEEAVYTKGSCMELMLNGDDCFDNEDK